MTKTKLVIVACAVVLLGAAAVFALAKLQGGSDKKISPYMQNLSMVLKSSCLQCHDAKMLDEKSKLQANPYWDALRDDKLAGLDPVANTKSFNEAQAFIQSHLGYYHLPQDKPDTMDRYRAIMAANNLAVDAGQKTDTAAVENWEAGITVDGKIVFERHCVQCHLNDSLKDSVPQFGNRTHWTELLKNESREEIYHDAIYGERGMPPRGGVPTLTDEAVRVGVDYLLTGKSPGQIAGDQICVSQAEAMVKNAGEYQTELRRYVDEQTKLSGDPCNIYNGMGSLLARLARDAQVAAPQSK